METVASVLIAFSLFSSLSAFIILGPRVYYAMAKGGHFFRFVSYIHPRFGVPTRSIALQAVIAIVLVLSGTFDQILTFMGFSLGIFPLLTVLGVFKLRASGKSSGLSAGFPVAPVVYSLAGTAILILAFFERPLESSIALGTVAAGLPLYVLFKRINRLS
jgi:APA family basic amino acid/polyamine antiporter